MKELEKETKTWRIALGKEVLDKNCLQAWTSVQQNLSTFPLQNFSAFLILIITIHSCLIIQQSCSSRSPRSYYTRGRNWLRKPQTFLYFLASDRERFRAIGRFSSRPRYRRSFAWRCGIRRNFIRFATKKRFHRTRWRKSGAFLLQLARRLFPPLYETGLPGKWQKPPRIL